jgi:plasmid stabilization system protein ParE
MTLELTRVAEQDVVAAFDWYELQRVGLGAEFLDALTRVFEKIEAAPESFSRPEDYLGGRKLRRALLRRFPYQIVFEIKSDEILLALAIAHTSRRPGFWQERID